MESSDYLEKPRKRSEKRRFSDTVQDPFSDEISAFTAVFQKVEEARLLLEELRFASEVEECKGDR